MTYTIEMLWACSTCGTKGNRGLDRFCPTCGKPKEDKDREYFPDDISEANALSGEKGRLARAGVDWKCYHCGSLQSAVNRYCTRCGSGTGKINWKPHSDSEVMVSESLGKREVSSFSDSPVNPEPEEEPDLETVREPDKKHSPPNPPQAVDQEVYLPKYKVDPRPFLILGAVLLLFWVLYLLFWPKEVDVEIVDSSWHHAVVIDRYHIVGKEGWVPAISAMNTKPLGLRFHHYDHIRVGSHTEIYTESVQCGQMCRTVPGSCSTTPRTCISNQNGTATCSGGQMTCSPSTQVCSPQYCPVLRSRVVDDYRDEPRYQMWYGWDEWEWTNRFRQVVRQGKGKDTYWPTREESMISLAPGEEERNVRESSYTVVFGRDGKRWEYRPRVEGEYLKLLEQKEHRIRVSVAGRTEVLR